MNPRRTLPLCAILVLAALAATANTTAQIEKTCPLDGTTFKATVDASGTSTGMQLDLKQLGPIEEPSRLVECPTDHFILFKDDLSPDEVSAYRALVASHDYRAAVAAGETSYFLLAKIYEQRHKPAVTLASIYLKASWQVDNGSPRYLKYAGASLDRFKEYLSHAPPGDEGRETAELVSGELERRLSKFDDARARFTRLSEDKQYGDPALSSIIRYELKLVAQRDTAPHPVPGRK